MRTPNRNARYFTQRRLSFTGHNLYAMWNGDRYVVYSYSSHWPLFVWANGRWFENNDRYSVTTSKHQSQAHPHEPTILLNREQMVELASTGLAAVTAARLEGKL